MPMRLKKFRSALISVASTLAMMGIALGADLGSPAPRIVEAPVAVPSLWTFRFIPYGWLTSINGTQTVRGRSTKVDASFIDIVEKSDTLLALMGNFEARNGPLALYTDLVWSKIGVDGSRIRTRALAPGIAGTLGASLALDVRMAILEVGAAYEVVRAGPLAVDVLGGVRYWHQNADLSFDLSAGVDVGDLDVGVTRGFARSGSVDWLDPLIGVRMRYALAPGHELFLRGDIGGFGVGSKFSWQAVGGYEVAFGTWHGIAFSGLLGYRALYVDYEQGSGRTRYQYDMLEHGPVVGVTMRF
jgi:hypothetical protein